MTGGVMSLTVTVTVNVQLPPPEAAHVTVVGPTGKVEPEKGLHVTVPHVPAVVGAG
jgi:hypothetical protein